MNLSYISDSYRQRYGRRGAIAIPGFKWWNFTFPTLETSGTDAVAGFVTATNGAVNFGGSVGALTAWGVSAATWGDPGVPAAGYAMRCSMPTPVPLGTVSTPFSSNTNTFAMSVLGGAVPATVDCGAPPASRPRSSTRWIAPTGW